MRYMYCTCNVWQEDSDIKINIWREIGYALHYLFFIG